MKTLVIGAHGLTGRRVVRRLLTQGHLPVAMIRRFEQKAVFDALGVSTVLGDLEYPIDHAVAGCDAVVLTACSGSKTGKDKTVLIDHIGAIRAMVTAAVHGARRFVLVSALNADPQSHSSIGFYHRAKGHADAFLRSMDKVMPDHPLDWTIFCPGRLTEEEGSGLVTVSPSVHAGAGVSETFL